VLQIKPCNIDELEGVARERDVLDGARRHWYAESC
jgi:hypothetical protein